MRCSIIQTRRQARFPRTMTPTLNLVQSEATMNVQVARCILTNIDLNVVNRKKLHTSACTYFILIPLPFLLSVLSNQRVVLAVSSYLRIHLSLMCNIVNSTSIFSFTIPSLVLIMKTILVVALKSVNSILPCLLLPHLVLVLPQCMQQVIIPLPIDTQVHPNFCTYLIVRHVSPFRSGGSHSLICSLH